MCAVTLVSVSDRTGEERATVLLFLYVNISVCMTYTMSCYTLFVKASVTK